MIPVMFIQNVFDLSCLYQSDQAKIVPMFRRLTLKHSEWSKLSEVLAILSAGLSKNRTTSEELWTPVNTYNQ